MNRFGQMALDHNRRHRPDACSQIPDPDRFFTQVGAEIAAEVTRLRDQILDQPRPGESLEAYRLRSYQALATAEELVLADHHLFQPETEEIDEDDPITDRYLRDLALINETIHTAP